MFKSLFVPLPEQKNAVFAGFCDPFPTQEPVLDHYDDDAQQRPAAANYVCAVMEDLSVMWFDMRSESQGPTLIRTINAEKQLAKSGSSGKSARATCGNFIPFILPTPDRSVVGATEPVHQPDDDFGPASNSHVVKSISDTSSVGVLGNIQGTPEKVSDPSMNVMVPPHDATHLLARPVEKRRQNSDVSDSTFVEHRTNSFEADVESSQPPLPNMGTGVFQRSQDREEVYTPTESDAAPGHSETSGAQPTLPARRQLDGHQYVNWVTSSLYRGVVGTSTGHIGVFTAHRYALSFQAHDCPVTDVKVILNTSDAPVQVNLVRGSSPNRGHHRTNSSLSDTNRTLQTLLNKITYVSRGEDGSIYVMKRRSADEFQRVALFQASFIKKTYAFAATNGVVVIPGHNFSSTLKLVSPSNVVVEDQVDLQGMFKVTDAMAMDGHYVVAARGEVVFGVDYRTKLVRRLLTCDSSVKHLYLSMPYGVASCENGRIVFFGAEDGLPLSDTGMRTPAVSSKEVAKDPEKRESAAAAKSANVAIGTSDVTFCAYNSSSVKSLVMHKSAMLACVVDRDTGAVEIVQLPTTFLRYRSLSQPRFLDQAAVLGRLIAMDEAADDAHLPQHAEAVILARYLVTDEARRYCGRQMKLL